MVDPLDAELLLGLLDRLRKGEHRRFAKQEIQIEIVLEISSICERHEYVGEDIPATINPNIFNDDTCLKRWKRILREFHLHGPLIVIVKQKESAIVLALMLNIDDVGDRSEEGENGLQINFLLGKEVEVFGVAMLEVKR